MIKLIKGLNNVTMLTPEGMKVGHLEIKDGKIHYIGEQLTTEGLTFNQNVIVIPGFIDEHIHGVNNSDTMDATYDALKNISQSLVKEGTTSYLPTTMTQSVDNIIKALNTIQGYMAHPEDGAEVLGVHLEGPFIHQDACGAQPKEYIVNPSVSQFKDYQKASGNAIKFVTIAPDAPGGLELIQYCKEHNIVASIGHTKATYEQTLEAIRHGASSVTHCFNAMTGLHHREIGVVGATLLHDELNAEVIADGIHVHPKAIELLYKNKSKNNMTLVTDSMRAKGLEDGEYELGGQPVIVKDGQARLQDGTLAGSTLSMIDAVRNSIKYLKVSLEEVVYMASTNPAKKLGVFNRKGSIEIGKDADLVVLNKDYEIVMTICNGRIAYQV